MTRIQKQEALENALRHYKFDKKYFIKPDEIKGQRFAIASASEYGGLNIHSNFMSYDEFNIYLFGYYAATIKKY